jgi:hypothetical protein
MSNVAGQTANQVNQQAPQYGQQPQQSGMGGMLQGLGNVFGQMTNQASQAVTNQLPQGQGQTAQNSPYMQNSPYPQNLMAGLDTGTPGINPYNSGTPSYSLGGQMPSQDQLRMMAGDPAFGQQAGKLMGQLGGGFDMPMAGVPSRGFQQQVAPQAPQRLPLNQRQMPAQFAQALTGGKGLTDQQRLAAQLRRG